MLTHSFATAGHAMPFVPVVSGPRRVRPEPAATGIEVKRPVETDLPGICRCLRDYRFHVLGDGPTADPGFPPDGRLTVHNTICDVNLDEKCWVAVRDSEVLGFCCWGWQDYPRRIAKTVLISVLTEARWLGLDSLLQNQRQEEMSAEGARELHAWSDDPKAISWYQQRFGYELVGYEPIYHCLHRFNCGSRTVWGIHRGHVGRDQLAHLRLKL